MMEVRRRTGYREVPVTVEKGPEMANELGRQNESGLLSSESVLNILKLIFVGAPLSEVLTIIAQLVEAQGEGMLCTIWLLDKDGKHLHCATAPSLPAPYVAQIDGIPVGPKGCSCGTAVHRKEPVYVTDILSDPLWDDYRHLAVPYGLRACWSQPLLSSDGKVLGTFASYHRDVRSPNTTDLQLIENAGHIAGIAIERHVNEEELRRSEARNAAIMDSALDCIVTIDHEGRITEFNLAAERTFGFHRDEVMGRPLADVIIPPSLRARHREGFARYLATGEARVLGERIEMPAVRADGSEFPVELAITRIPLDGPPSFTGYLRDITERKRSEEKLRRSEAYLAEAQKLSLTGSFGWNVSADDHFWSDETFRIFEYDVSTKVTLQLILERVHPQDVPFMRQAIALAADGRDLDYECRLLMPAGSVKHLHIVAHSSRDQDGRLEYIGAVQDVTQRRLSEEALGKARSELARVARVTSLGALTASIAHEVNQPLSGIITNASTCLRMLAADPPNIVGALETARRTIRDGHRASEVITRLRAFFSKKDATTESVDLNEATREVLALSSHELQRGQVILQPELADDLPPVAGDRVQLQQVILNLLLNASEAMSGVDDRPRQLAIRTARDDSDCVRLSVQDSGVGIEPQGMDKLFEAFYTTKSGGMGIGLSVSRSIIESHHGRLWATPNDGPGATFSFSIPRISKGVTDAEHVMRSL
jgi:PAS domain S-box-containing protein